MRMTAKVRELNAAAIQGMELMLEAQKGMPSMPVALKGLDDVLDRYCRARAAVLVELCGGWATEDVPDDEPNTPF